MWKKISAVLIPNLIAAALIGFMLMRVWDDLLVAVQHLVPAYLIAAILICLAAWYLRGWRYQYIIERLGTTIGLTFSTACIYVSQTANLIIPARLGDFVRLFILKHEKGTTYTNGFTSIVAERVYDIIIIAVLGLFALPVLISLVPAWFIWINVLVLGAGAVFFLFLLLSHRLHAENKIFKAIEALVDKGVDDIEYVFVGAIGEAPIKKQLEDACTKYSFVKYYPIMPREEALGMLSGATALLVPSRDDPSPLVASEAMMLGVPVIVSDRTGTAALIASGTNGFVIENENYMELAEKILWLVNNPEEARRIGTKGRKIYEQYYSMERFNSEYIAIVNKIIYLSKFKRPLKRVKRWLLGKLHSLYRCI